MTPTPMPKPPLPHRDETQCTMTSSHQFATSPKPMPKPPPPHRDETQCTMTPPCDLPAPPPPMPLRRAKAPPRYPCREEFWAEVKELAGTDPEPPPALQDVDAVLTCEKTRSWWNEELLSTSNAFMKLSHEEQEVLGRNYHGDDCEGWACKACMDSKVVDQECPPLQSHARPYCNLCSSVAPWFMYDIILS